MRALERAGMVVGGIIGEEWTRSEGMKEIDTVQRWTL